MKQKSKLIKTLLSNDIFLKGEFIGRSGKKLNMYCNLKKAYGAPKVLAEIAKEIKKIIPRNCTCIAGLGFGGIPLGVAVSRETGLPLVLVRDQVKEHGTKSLVEGYQPTKKDKLYIVDDVYTTGKSIRDTCEKLALIDCKVSGAAVFLVWNKPNENFPVKYVFNANKLKL
jgi:orotate phosphoribosyltransferase